MSETQNKYEPGFENRIDLGPLEEKMNAVKREVKKVICERGDFL